jgi:hypothetical protein
MNICIRNPQTKEWTSSVGRSGGGGVSPAIRDTYAGYKDRSHYYQERPHITGEYIVYRPDDDAYLPTYIARTADIPALNDGTGLGAGLGVGARNNLANNITITREIHASMETAGVAIPIIDMNDISVFIITSMDGADWLPCREYQAWAYRDFVYDEHRNTKKSYMSPYSSHSAFNNTILVNQIVTIPVSNIAPNIVFNISRNENNSVYFERNDATGSRVRMCDNEYARMGYRGFYTRITMDVGAVVVPPPPGWGGGPAVYYNIASSSSPPVPVTVLSTAHLPAPEETDDEEHQCILCFKFSVNARFSPCEHKVCCSACYSKMTKNECPVCRAVITRVMNV